jgi:SulP family sulfate permease
VPVGAGYSGTAANESFGARSRLAGAAAAIVIAAALCLLRDWVARIPEPVLAAIVIFAMRHAVSLEPLRPYLLWKRDRSGGGHRRCRGAAAGRARMACWSASASAWRC